MPEKFDWIQLKSGEWLKGEFIAMYDHEMEFDSDELDDLTFDCVDIYQVRTARIVQVLFLGHVTATGQLLMEGKKIRILGEEEQEFDRSGIISISPGVSRRNFWSGSLNIGFNVRKGNSDQIETNGTLKIQRRTVKNRITLDYIANFNETESVEVANNHRVNLGSDMFLTNRFFINPIYGEYFRDPFQNIDARTTVGVGAGYQIFDSPKTEWEVSGGPAY